MDLYKQHYELEVKMATLRNQLQTLQQQDNAIIGKIVKEEKEATEKGKATETHKVEEAKA